MIGGWLPPRVRHELQDELIAMQQLVTLGKCTLEQANDALRRVVELTNAVTAGILTEEQCEAIVAQAALVIDGEGRTS